jgi:hypothetical protein
MMNPPTVYPLMARVIARIDGADRQAEIRGRCHPMDRGVDLYDVMTADRVIHCNLRVEQLTPAVAIEATVPVLKIGRAR